MNDLLLQQQLACCQQHGIGANNAWGLFSPPRDEANIMAAFSFNNYIYMTQYC